MLRVTRPRAGLWKAIKEEFGKLIPLVKHDIKSGADFLTGADETEKQKKVRKAQQDLEDLDNQRIKEELKKLSFTQRLQYFADSMKAATGKNAAVVALVQHCTRAHMAEVAVESDIDVRNVNIVTETVRSEVGQSERVVGYIDAPKASEEEVMAYATKLQQACPAARTHGGIEWRQVQNKGGDNNSSSPSTGGNSPFKESTTTTTSSSSSSSSGSSSLKGSGFNFAGPRSSSSSAPLDDFEGDSHFDIPRSTQPKDYSAATTTTNSGGVKIKDFPSLQQKRPEQPQPFVPEELKQKQQKAERLKEKVQKVSSPSIFSKKRRDKIIRLARVSSEVAAEELKWEIIQKLADMVHVRPSSLSIVADPPPPVSSASESHEQDNKNNHNLRQKIKIRIDSENDDLAIDEILHLSPSQLESLGVSSVEIVDDDDAEDDNNNNNNVEQNEREPVEEEVKKSDTNKESSTSSSSSTKDNVQSSKSSSPSPSSSSPSPSQTSSSSTSSTTATTAAAAATTAAAASSGGGGFFSSFFFPADPTMQQNQEEVLSKNKKNTDSAESSPSSANLSKTEEETSDDTSYDDSSYDDDGGGGDAGGGDGGGDD